MDHVDVIAVLTVEGCDCLLEHLIKQKHEEKYGRERN